ncbi:MAG: hypothetical protein ACNS60_08360 [Candidatus Cyclobacteriaceae bacterium M2_1C_046]
MRYIILSLSLFFTLQLAAQNVAELDKRNGFQDIKMASAIKSYEGLEYKKDVENEIFPGAKLYVPKKGFYENIGELKIYDLEVLVYEDSIFQVTVITKKDRLLYKGLKTAFGEPEFSMRTGKSQWNGNKVRLIYDDHSKKKMEMIYFSHEMVKKLKKDKKEEIIQMSDEF